MNCRYAYRDPVRRWIMCSNKRANGKNYSFYRDGRKHYTCSPSRCGYKRPPRTRKEFNDRVRRQRHYYSQKKRWYKYRDLSRG